MYVQRAAFVWVCALLGFLACSTAPTSGTSTSTTAGTGGKGGSTSTTSNTGGMDGGTCEPREDYYEFCGDCRRCVEEKCCPELIACEKAPGCIDCISNNPDSAGPCGQQVGEVYGCAADCFPCYPKDAAPNPGCFLDAGPDGG